MAAFLAPTAGAAPFENGSFESPTATPRLFDTYSSGESIGPWTVTRGTVDHIGEGYWEASHGTQSLDLSGDNDGAVAQSFTTFPLFSYVIDFSLSGNPDGGPEVKTGVASVNNRVVREFSFDTTETSRTDMRYQHERFSFWTLGTAATLEFTGTSATAYGAVIDDVTVTPCLLIFCGASMRL